MTPSGCQSRGSSGLDCRVVCVIYVYAKKLRIIIGSELRERRARDVVMSWGLRGAGKAVWVWAWGSQIWVGCASCAGFCISRKPR